VPAVLNSDMEAILANAAGDGWVLEPDTKRLLALAGLAVPRSAWARSLPEALASAAAIGYPLAVKVVSPQIIHKSDAGGVAVGIETEAQLSDAYRRFTGLPGFGGVLVEQLVSGVELIVGAKIDYQFGPVILLGIGGTGVEIYQDVTLRMAPLSECDVGSMIRGLRGSRLLTGYRGRPGVSAEALTRLMMHFSALVLDMGERFASIDLNPVRCTDTACVVADARIMLAEAPAAG
jgi:hypothetical protein